jgi:hypothetical protein
VGGIAVAVAAVTTIIIVIQGANLQTPADVVQQEPSRQTAISVAETVTITIPEGQQVRQMNSMKNTMYRSLQPYQVAHRLPG